MWKIYLVNTPMLFRAVWAIIKPWLHPATAAKVRFGGGGGGGGCESMYTECVCVRLKGAHVRVGVINSEQFEGQTGQVTEFCT